MIIALSGLISSGKDTLAQYLVSDYGFIRVAFASTLKDASAAIFGWDREMLEGATKEAREAREEIDFWWANRLGIPELSPRWVLQHLGTDCLRKHFHSDIWLASLENTLRKMKNKNVIISDARFVNELDLVRSMGGVCLCVVRGELPEWYRSAVEYNAASDENKLLLKNRTDIPNIFNYETHESEWAWAGYNFDSTLTNNGTLREFTESFDGYLNEHNISKIR